MYNTICCTEAESAALEKMQNLLEQVLLIKLPGGFLLLLFAVPAWT